MFVRLLTVALLGACSILQAQEQDTIAESLGLTPETGSLPIWTRPDEGDATKLGEVARLLRQGVLLVGTASDGHGTAFVISKRHRLLVTNAHVADIYQKSGKMLAVLNEGTAVWQVERVWCHPGVLRVLDERSFAIGRSTDPQDGSVYPRSPDLAILQLRDDGPDLPIEFSFASQAELSDVFAKTVAIIGFPGHDTKGWPGLGERPQATFHGGVISRTTDFLLNNSDDSAERQFLQHTAMGLGGFSGSPMLLPDGRVVGIHNAFRPVDDRGAEAVMSHAIRIDCLWEALAYHKLTELVPIPVDPNSFDLARFDSPDPKIENYRQVRALTEKAKTLNKLGEHAEAAEAAAQALALVPNHPEAIYQKSIAHNNYAVTYKQRLPQSVIDEQHASANYYARRLLQVAPSDVRSTLISLLYVSNAAARKHSRGQKQAAIRDQQMVRSAVTRLIDSGNIRSNKDLARAYEVRANANLNLVINQSGTDISQALLDNSEAIRLDPDNRIIYFESRAENLTIVGRHREAAVWTRKARELKAKLRESN